MKIYKYTIFTIMLFLLCISNPYAACTKEEINGFKRIEDEYTIKYEIDKSTKKYNVYFYGTNMNLYDYLIYAKENFDCEKITETTLKCGLLSSGEHKVEIVGQTETCNDVLKKITLKLPKYNVLSEDPLCKGIEEFVLCNPSYEKEIDYDTFVSRVNTYKKNHQETKVEEEKEEPKEENTYLDNIIDYIKDNLITIIIVTVFIILVIITIIVTAKSIRKSRRLE